MTYLSPSLFLPTSPSPFPHLLIFPFQFLFYFSVPDPAIVDSLPELANVERASLKSSFSEFAKCKRFDPLVPESWYPITITDIRSFLVYLSSFSLSSFFLSFLLHPSSSFSCSFNFLSVIDLFLLQSRSRKTLRPFQYDHIEALLEFYPNIGLRPEKFISTGT